MRRVEFSIALEKRGPASSSLLLWLGLEIPHSVYTEYVLVTVHIRALTTLSPHQGPYLADVRTRKSTRNINIDDSFWHSLRLKYYSFISFSITDSLAHKYFASNVCLSKINSFFKNSKDFLKKLVGKQILFNINLKKKKNHPLLTCYFTWLVTLKCNQPLYNLVIRAIAPCCKSASLAFSIFLCGKEAKGHFTIWIIIIGGLSVLVKLQSGEVELPASLWNGLYCSKCILSKRVLGQQI